MRGEAVREECRRRAAPPMAITGISAALCCSSCHCCWHHVITARCALEGCRGAAGVPGGRHTCSRSGSARYTRNSCPGVGAGRRCQFEVGTRRRGLEAVRTHSINDCNSYSRTRFQYVPARDLRT